MTKKAKTNRLRKNIFIMGILARIYAAVECAVIIILALIGSRMTAPVFIGLFTTAVLAVIGWVSKNTDRTYRSNKLEIK